MEVRIETVAECVQRGQRDPLERYFLTPPMRMLEYLHIQEKQDVPQIAEFKAEFFKALAHSVRIRILDTLRGGEKSVNELSELLKIEPANVSQQLALLRFRNIVTGRKAGSNVFYSVTDPKLFELLDVAKEIFNSHLVGVRDMLKAVRR